jgi:hypothetical protein
VKRVQDRSDQVHKDVVEKYMLKDTEQLGHLLQHYSNCAQVEHFIEVYE